MRAGPFAHQIGCQMFSPCAHQVRRQMCGPIGRELPTSPKYLYITGLIIMDQVSVSASCHSTGRLFFPPCGCPAAVNIGINAPARHPRPTPPAGAGSSSTYPGSSTR